MTDEERAKVSEMLVEMRMLRFVGRLAGGAGLVGLGVLLGRWTKRDQRR